MFRLIARAVTAAAVISLSVATSAGAVPRQCSWALQTTANQTNIAFPDQAAYYWTAALPIPPGGHIEIAGQYPHARYTSITTYTPRSQAIDGIHDTDIQPDPGSSNPFLAGADRTVASRSYTVQIVNDRIPAGGRAPNTVYTENADGSKSTKAENMAVFILRIYVPDRGTDIDGGVPLPTVSVVSADGQRVTAPQCPDVVPDTGVNQALAASGAPNSPPPTVGSAVVGWHKYTNLGTAAVNGYGDGTPLPAALTPTTDQEFGTGGFFENLDNNYIYANMDRSFGQVLVLHAKAPTTPQTIDGETTMGTGQLRYWSVCTESGQTTQFFGCTNDELVPVDSSGYYTIVISTAAARPSNANLDCGITWLPAGPMPRTVLLVRNMLPDPSFAQAIQKVRVGHEQQDMGEYYPAGTYYATALDYERTGCNR